MGKQRPIDKCKLCGLVKELCDSHYLPKRLYTFGRAGQLKNPNPVMEVNGELKQISSQYRDYVFCQQCEDLLNKNGERWVLANIPQDYDGAFPLQVAINKLTPVLLGDGLVLCNVSGQNAFDVEHLVYFGMSIFWRGAVHEWKTTSWQIAPKVDLGRLEESIRAFLHGDGSFPHGLVLTIDIWPYCKALQVSYPVLASHLPECQRYWFHIPGLLFSLYLGTSIPRDILLRNAVNGMIALDMNAANSVLEFTKQGILSKGIGPKIQETLQAIDAIRSKKSADQS